MDLENQHGRMDAEQAQNCAEFDDPGCTECEKPPCPTLIQQRTGKLLMTLPFAMMRGCAYYFYAFRHWYY